MCNKPKRYHNRMINKANFYMLRYVCCLSLFMQLPVNAYFVLSKQLMATYELCQTRFELCFHTSLVFFLYVLISLFTNLSSDSYPSVLAGGSYFPVRTPHGLRKGSPAKSFKQVFLSHME